jgi:hypothetical protein
MINSETQDETIGAKIADLVSLNSNNKKNHAPTIPKRRIIVLDLACLIRQKAEVRNNEYVNALVVG